MQEQYGVPTVLQQALRAVDVVAEQVRRESAGFCFYTGNKGIYTAPDISAAGAQAEQQQQLLQQLQQLLSKPVPRAGPVSDEEKLAVARDLRDLDDFIRMYCRPVPQAKVRVHSKEQTGTQPYFTWCAPNRERGQLGQQKRAARGEGLEGEGQGDGKRGRRGGRARQGGRKARGRGRASTAAVEDAGVVGEEGVGVGDVVGRGKKTGRSRGSSRLQEDGSKGMKARSGGEGETTRHGSKRRSGAAASEGRNVRRKTYAAVDEASDSKASSSSSSSSSSSGAVTEDDSSSSGEHGNMGGDSDPEDSNRGENPEALGPRMQIRCYPAGTVIALGEDGGVSYAILKESVR